MWAREHDPCVSCDWHNQTNQHVHHGPPTPHHPWRREGLVSSSPPYLYPLRKTWRLRRLSVLRHQPEGLSQTTELSEHTEQFLKAVLRPAHVHSVLRTHTYALTHVQTHTHSNHIFQLFIIMSIY